MLLAGLSPVGVIGEIVADDGEMMRLPGLIELGARDGLPVTTVAALIEWMNEWHTGHDLAAGASRGRARVVARRVRGRDLAPDRARRVPRARLPRPRDGRRPRRDHRRRPRRRPGGRRRARALGVPDRRGLRIAEVRVRAAARRRARRRSRSAAASSCTCAATRAAASGSSTSSAPTACRRTASTRSTRTSRSACPIDARDYGAATAILADLGIDTRAPAHEQPREGAPARGARHPRRRAAAARRRRRRRQRRATSTRSGDRMGHAIDDQQLTDAAAETLLEGHAS